MINDKKICFYHKVDPDGWCSAAILYDYWGRRDHVFYGINHGDRFPWARIDSETEVWMLDFSLSISGMIRLAEKCKRLVWVDHHKTTLEDKHIYEPGFEGLQREGDAGCELLWEFLYGDEEMPQAVHLIGRYDVWKWHDVPGSLEFTTGLRSREWASRPKDSFWTALISSEHPGHNSIVNHYIEDGKLLLKCRNRDWRIYVLGHAFATTLILPNKFAEYSVVACNRGGVNSQFFDFRELESLFHYVDFAVNFAWKRGQWKVGLWKPDWIDNDIHCGDIAKTFGGGGHEGAAGFRCKSLPFEIV
jgi:uncharacterized protein